MPKYLLHVPVNGYIEMVIEADSEEDALDNYIEQRENLLESEPFELIDDFDTAYVVKINDKLVC